MFPISAFAILVLACTYVFLSKTILGFGGDIYGLRLDYFKIANHSDMLSVGNAVDYGFKFAAFQLSDNFFDFLKLIQIKTILIHGIFCILTVKEVERRVFATAISANIYQLLGCKNQLALFLLLFLNPYFISSVLAGHTSFYLGVTFWCGLICSSIYSRSIAFVLIAFINPYLSTIFALINLVDMIVVRRFSKREMGIHLIAGLVVIIVILTLQNYQNDLWFESVGRQTSATGVLPHHLIIPPFFQLGSFVSINFTNWITIYSNVPEMFLFIGWGGFISLFFLVAKGNRSKILWLFALLSVLYILSSFPPKTSYFEKTIFFPSALIGFLLEDFRMISRNAAAIGFALLIFPLLTCLRDDHTSFRKLGTILWVFVILSIPTNLPKLTEIQDTSKLVATSTQINESCKLLVLWPDFYAFSKLSETSRAVECNNSAFKTTSDTFKRVNQGKLAPNGTLRAKL